MSEPPTDTNPFATRFVRPGALPYLFPAGESAAAIVARLERNDWWGQIIGPHGSGKSTLLKSLAGPLEAAGRRLVRYTLHDGQRRLPSHETDPHAWDAATLAVVDGYEQLSWSQRGRLKSTCRRRHAGLLVTAHGDVKLPPVWHTTLTVETAWQVVSQLLAGGGRDGKIRPCGDAIISRQDVAACFQRHPGDLRETLFELYDLYEQRRG